MFRSVCSDRLLDQDPYWSKSWFFSLFTTQNKNFYMVSPQTVFTYTFSPCKATSLSYYFYACFVIVPIVAHMLRMYRKDQPKLLMSYKQNQKDRQDPVKSRRPDLPITSGIISFLHTHTLSKNINAPCKLFM